MHRLSIQLRRTPGLRVVSLISCWTPLVGSMAVAQVPTLCEEELIVPATLAAGDEFGFVTAAGPGRAVFGALRDDTAGTDAGTVYVYVESGGAWQLDEQLFSSQPEAGARFGWELVLDGDRLAVGAPFEDEAGLTNVGAVHVFVHDGAGWQFEQRITPSNPHPSEWFGRAISLEGDRMVLGDASRDVGGVNSAGAVWIYERVGGTWVEAELIETPNPTNTGNFGWEVELEGDTLFVGAQLEAGQNGRVYVYEFDGVDWQLDQTIPNPSPSVSDERFGGEIALDGARVAIGALFDTGSAFEAGAAHVYRREPGGWVYEQGVWPEGQGNNDWFSKDLHLQGDVLLASAPFERDDGVFGVGAVHLFRRSGTEWHFLQRMRASDAAPNHQFGQGLTRYGELVVIGSPGHAAQGAGAGAGYVARVVDLFTRYCTASPNSTGSPARMSATGSKSLSANDLVLRASPVPDQPGVFFYGPTQASVPFGNGTRCIDGPFQRLDVVNGSGNELVYELDNQTPPTPAGQLTPGSTWHFQAWFRDPAAGGASFDLSDAVSITFAP